MQRDRVLPWDIGDALVDHHRRCVRSSRPTPVLLWVELKKCSDLHRPAVRHLLCAQGHPALHDPPLRREGGGLDCTCVPPLKFQGDPNIILVCAVVGRRRAAPPPAPRPGRMHPRRRLSSPVSRPEVMRCTSLLDVLSVCLWQALHGRLDRAAVLR